MKQERIYRDFDLPTKHLEKGRHFVVPKAHDEEEEERRLHLPKGILIAEYQERGLAVAASILKHLNHSKSVPFASRIIAAAGVNAAWYTYGRGAENEVMRRRLKLPPLYFHNPDLRPTSSDILCNSAFMYESARPMTNVLRGILMEQEVPKVEETKRKVGQTIGNASLWLASVDLGDKLIEYPLTEADTSNLTRQRGMQMLYDARNLHSELGEHPSIAGFAYPDSAISVFWRREAPTDAVKAYHSAVELTLAA